MLECLKERLTYFKFFIRFKKYLNTLLAEEMKNLPDGKHEVTLSLDKKDSVLKIIGSDKVFIEIDGEAKELPFSQAMFMMNEISSSYLKSMKTDIVRRAFGFKSTLDDSKEEQ